MLAQTIGITPYTSVVDDQRVLDAVLGVVHFGRVLGVDHLDQVAVGADGVVGFINGDGAVERAMNRVTTQQAGALDQVVLGAFADDDGAQTQAVAATGFSIRMRASRRPIRPKPYSTTSVPLRAPEFCWPTISAISSRTNCSAVRPLAFGLELDRQLAQVDRSGTQFKLAHRFDERESLVYGQLGRVGLDGDGQSGAP
jgi:hypothetical protein